MRLRKGNFGLCVNQGEGGTGEALAATWFAAIERELIGNLWVKGRAKFLRVNMRARLKQGR